MKQILLLLSLWFVIVSGAMGQTLGPGSGPGQPVWQRYTVKDEEFSVTLPLFPAMTTTKAARTSDGEHRLVKRLRTTLDGVEYTIEAFENPKPRQSLEQFVEEVGLASEFGFDPATKRHLRIDGVDVIEYSSTHSNAAMVQFLATEKHLYRFIAGGPARERRAVMEIFTSIKLGKTP